MEKIIVRGAGIIGLSVAWECVQRGAKVKVVDPNGVGGGATGASVGGMAPHAPDNWNETKQLQLDGLLAAADFWTSVEERSGLPSGFARTGRLQPIPNQPALELARARVKTAETAWQGRATWQVIPTKIDDEWQPKSNTGHLVFDDLSARIHPKKACHSLAVALHNSGVEFLAEFSEVDDKNIWAAGVAGLNQLYQHIGSPVVAGVKGQAVLLRPKSTVPSYSPQVYADGVHIIPHQDGGVAVGSTTEKTFDYGYSTDEQLNDVIFRAQAALPMLASAAVVERWAGLRPRANARGPVLGHWPDRQHHYIANGSFKIGFSIAPAVAQLMADLVLEGHNRIPSELSVPRRAEP